MADRSQLSSVRILILDIQGKLYKEKMTVSIRPHHLLCMLTYLGKGYTPDFVTNYSDVIRRLNNGEQIELISGPDEICQPMLGETGCHCFNENVRERDDLCRREVGELLQGAPLDDGLLDLSAEQLASLRSAFAAGTIRSACSGCEWFELCSDIARKKFRGCRFQPPQ